MAAERSVFAEAMFLREVAAAEDLTAAAASIGRNWICVPRRARDLEIVKQCKLNWCWAALGVSLGLYFDQQFSLSQCAFVQEVRGMSRCPDEAHDFALVLGAPVINRFNRVEDPPEAFAQVSTETAQGLPVTFLLDSDLEPKTVNHLVVVTCCRTDGARVEIGDPANGRRRTLGFGELQTSSCCSFHVE